jgi:hypothetical protein
MVHVRRAPCNRYPILFHPDYDRRPRNRTESADLAAESSKRSRAMRVRAITAGGEFRPALRTLRRKVKVAVQKIYHGRAKSAVHYYPDGYVVTSQIYKYSEDGLSKFHQRVQQWL